MPSRTLTRFQIEPHGEQFKMHIEDDAGERIEFDVDREQLEVIVDHLDDLLSSDDADED